MDIRRKGLE
jgi:WD40 repeat protein